MDFGSGLKNFVTYFQRADNLIGEKESIKRAKDNQDQKETNS